MMTEGIKWRFPQSDYGEVKGINDAGVETFTSETLKYLVRETIQNSLDADRDQGAITVEFEEYEIRPDAIPGIDGLKDAMLLCAFEGDRQDNDDARVFFKNALSVGAQNSIRVMRVSDHGTTGLRGANACEPGNDWSRLIKESGSSSKGGKAGGSFGIGKNSTFACSSLRTVLFSSLDDEGVESHIGVSKLMSFKPKGSDRYTTGTGYYSGSEKNVAIMGQLDMPGFIKRETDDPGTDILILGFKCDGDITRGIIKHSLVQFLVSIWQGKLVVKVNGERIDASNLGVHVGRLNGHDPDELVRETIEHYDLLTSTDDSVKIIDFNPKELKKQGPSYQFGWEEGDCILWLKKGGSNLNRRVMYTRAAGMRLFNQKNISGNIRFTGILMIVGEKMNQDFKDMEVPSHDRWAPERTDDPKLSAKMVQQLRGWVTSKVIESFSKKVEDQMEAYGTALYLPKREAEKDGGNEEETETLEHSVAAIVTKDLTPKRQERKVALHVDDLKPDHDGEGVLHGSGSAKGTEPRRGKPGGSASGYTFVSVRERLICTDREAGEYRLSFTVPHTAKRARILLSTFGEQGADTIDVKSATATAGVEGDILCESNEIRLGPVRKDANAVITFVTGFPRYCMMGADYYEAN